MSRETHETTPTSHGSSCHYPSRAAKVDVESVLLFGVFFFLEAYQSYFLFSLSLFSFILTILIFFNQTQNFKNKKISLAVFKIFS